MIGHTRENPPLGGLDADQHIGIRDSSSHEPGGEGPENELTLTCGLPPAKADVVLMRRVRVPGRGIVIFHCIVVGLFTP
jgi:hypothetical protein